MRAPQSRTDTQYLPFILNFKDLFLVFEEQIIITEAFQLSTMH